jgi:hypothetical protein
MANTQTYLNSYRIANPVGASFLTGATVTVIASKGGGGLNGAQSNNVVLSDGTSTGSTQTGENFNILGDVTGDSVNNGVNNGTSTYIGVATINGVSGVIVFDPNGQGGGGYFFLTGVTLAVGTTGTIAVDNTADLTTQWVLGGTTSAPPSAITVTDNVGSIQGLLVTGQRSDDTTPTFAGTANAGAVVKIFLNGGATAVATVNANNAGNWTWTPSAALTDGSYSYTATQTDTSGTTSAASTAFVITVDTTPPTAPVVSSVTDNVGALVGALSNGASTDDTTLTLAGTAEAGATVTLFNGATQVGSTTADGTGAWSATTSTLADGPVSLTATATDTAGNTSLASTAGTFTVDTAAPTAPVVSSVTDNVGATQGPLSNGAITDDNTLTLAGTTEAGATVTLFNGATEVGSTTADGTGAWSATTSTLADGPVSLTVTATDTAGNISAASSTLDFTLTAPLCYLAGTRILTPTGQVAIQNLQIGDLVVTRWQGIQPIKWIGRQSYAAPFIAKNPAKNPVLINAHALGDQLPSQPLAVSPGHSMLLGDTLVLAKLLVNGVTITQNQTAREVEYFQIELEMHDCVIAEGAWSETYADCEGQRGQFHNAAEFERMYPDHRPPEELHLCAHRPEMGPQLDAVLRPVVERARIGLHDGPLRGSIDQVVGPWKIEGWAQDRDQPELPVLLEVLLGSEVIGTVLACDYRSDLAAAGIGRGRCSFVFRSPVRLRPEETGALRLRRASDRNEIRMSDNCLAAINNDQTARIMGPRLVA